MSKNEPFGIYIHIPYCKSKCRYCDFYSAPGARGVPQGYVDALLRELGKNTRRPDTVYSVSYTHLDVYKRQLNSSPDEVILPCLAVAFAVMLALYGVSYKICVEIYTKKEY